MALQDISATDLISHLAVVAYSQQQRLPHRKKPWQLLFHELKEQQGDKPKFLEDLFFDSEEYPICRELNTLLAFWMGGSLNSDGTLNIDVAAHLKPKYDTLEPATRAYVDQAVELAKKHFEGYAPVWPATIQLGFKNTEASVRQTDL
jgi:hypothetical protein